MIRMIKAIAVLVIVICLLLSNVLSVTASAFNGLTGFVTGALGAASMNLRRPDTVERQRAALLHWRDQQKGHLRKAVSRKAIGSTLAWVPILGSSVAAILMIRELSQLCDQNEEMNALMREMQIEHEEEACLSPSTQ